MLSSASISVQLGGVEQITIGQDTISYNPGSALGVSFKDNGGSPGLVSETASTIYHLFNYSFGSGITFNLQSLLAATAGEGHPGGDTFVFTAVKAIAIFNRGPVDVQVGNAGSNAWQGPISASTYLTVPAGTPWGQAITTAAGWVVTSGAKNLLITPVAGTGNIDLYLVGDATYS
jgi:hypothetical protein